MIKYKIKQKSITIDSKTIALQNTVKDIYEYNNKLIVLLNYKENSKDNEPNVYAFNDKGTPLWEIDLIKDSTNKYIQIKEEKGQLILVGENHFKYIVNDEDGKFIKTQIMPLKDIDDDSQTLLTKQNWIQLGIVLIISIFLLIGIKNSVTSLFTYDPPEKEESTQITSEESKSSSLEEIESSEIITEEEKPPVNSSENNSQSSTSQVEESKPNTNNKEQNKTENKEENKENSSNKTEEKDKYEGINQFVGITDAIIGAITNGDKASIEDVNNQKTTCIYLGVIDSTRIKVQINNEEKIVKLISIKDTSDCTQAISSFLSGTSNIYLEQDNKKTNSDGEILAYVWITEDKSDKNNMLNYYLLKNDLAVYEMQSPNIKYNYYFQ